MPARLVKVNGDDSYYEACFEAEGPLGIEFYLNKAGTSAPVISDVTGAAISAGVQVGDIVQQINGAEVETSIKRVRSSKTPCHAMNVGSHAHPACRCIHEFPGRIGLEIKICFSTA